MINTIVIRRIVDYFLTGNCFVFTTFHRSCIKAMANQPNVPFIYYDWSSQRFSLTADIFNNGQCILHTPTIMYEAKSTFPRRPLPLSRPQQCLLPPLALASLPSPALRLRNQLDPCSGTMEILHGSQDESFLVALQSTYIRSSISYHMAARQSSVVAMHLIISTRSIPSLCTEKVDPWKLKHFFVGRSKLLALLRWGVPAIQWLVAAAVRSQQPSSSSEELSSSVGLIAGTWRDTRKTQSLSMDRKSGRFCFSNSQPLTICDNNHLKTSPRM